MSLTDSRLITGVLLFLICSAAAVDRALAQGSAPWVGSTLEGMPCPSPQQGYGPFDYLNRGALRKQLKLVEDYHFTPEVENLVRGTTGTVVGDLGYTLRAWPNHHRALNAMMREQARRSEAYLRGENVPPLECYLQRAMNYSPGDSTVRMLYAMFLHRKGLLERALAQYEAGEQLAPKDMQLLYNKGLLLLDMQRFDEARRVADRVYEAGFPLPGLRRRLAEAGRD